MYGLLIEAIVYQLKLKYGEETWEEIRKRANLSQMTFSTHDRYGENVVQVIALAASDITGRSTEELMDSFGVFFVSFVAQYGYDRILNVLGRNLRDFLNGLDNLHEYLRFSYPKLRPPSFFCENESRTGLTLHYRSKRRGYVHYVKGQIRQVANTFYKTHVDIEIVSEEHSEGMTHIVYKLYFDNTAFKDKRESSTKVNDSLPVSSKVFFELFPFHVMFNRSTVILNVGRGLASVMRSNLHGKKIEDVFKVIRPIVSFTWETILGHTNNVYEIVTKKEVQRRHSVSSEDEEEEEEYGEEKDTDVSSMDTTYYLDEAPNHLLLKGQMMHISEWDNIVFLGTPILENIDSMFMSGVFVNDLSMHDSSRDLVLAGTQQSSELRLALDKEEQKCKSLEENMRKLDEEIKRSDQLLYQMIPKAVANRLRKGEPAVNTCQIYDNVTVLFSDVVGFNEISCTISPMEVVSLLNAMYTVFDHLSEKNSVYKVETVGDAYMVVSGAPEITPYHAINICDMAIDMIRSMMDLRDPSTNQPLKIRIGVHSGSVVAGVVGLKMLRFCLFGDTVNTASRMQSNGESLKIHVSESTYNEVKSGTYDLRERGVVSIKGKGSMHTYWLLGKTDGSNINPMGSSIFEEIAMASRNTPSPDYVNAETRSLYTPVPFSDVLRLSTTTTPHTTPVKTIGTGISNKQHGQHHVLFNMDLQDEGDFITVEQVRVQGSSSSAKANARHVHYRSKTCVML